MDGNDRRNFLEIEDELNDALEQIGKDIKIHEDMDEKISALTVQELLEELKIDEFEKMYITTTALSNTPNMEKIPDEKLDEVKTVAEYQLSQMNKEQTIDEKNKTKLKSASNFYIIPRTAQQKLSVGSHEQTQKVDLYTVNDNEGYCLYTIIGNDNVTISKNFRDEIEKYLTKNYSKEIESKEINVDEVVENFTPHNMDELYEKVGEEYSTTMRFLPMRIDEYARSKGISENSIGSKELQQNENDNLDENNKVTARETIDNRTKDELEQYEKIDENKFPDEEIIEEEKEPEEEKETKYETYIEKIARNNNVSPSVVNTRVVEDFEKVEEDTGIRLRGRYRRGDVIAVRIPYKLQYRTFLVDRNTGMTIDGKGILDRRPGKLYDFDEVEEYFRFRLRSGEDGGDNGRPLRRAEKDYITYIDNNGEVKEEKFVNNGKKIDMQKDERERYLTEVSEADKRLEEAIEEYQNNSTHENYKKVRAIIKEKVDIDNKYNALTNQKDVTKKTIENTEKVIDRDLDEDDWFPDHER